MTDCCPTCGQPIVAPKRDEAWLLDLLTNGDPHREVYLGADSSWYVTYGGGGPVDPAAVQALARRGAISPVYNKLPTQSYHIGKTMHVERTLAERKKLGRRDVKIYVGDPESTDTGSVT